jgi:hypothetical protein
VLLSVGGRSECETLDRLLEAVRAGESRALVVRGEPGVGKIALLQHVVERASPCQVVARAAGVRAEMEQRAAGRADGDRAIGAIVGSNQSSAGAGSHRLASPKRTR